jgi:hypothetical protein
VAKQSGKSAEQSGKVKIRVIEFEVEGSDSTMQESLKSITAALNRGMTASPATRVRYVQPAPQLEDGTAADAAEPEGEEVEGESEPAVTPAAPRRVTSPRRPPAPKLLDIQFSDVSPTLREFVASKAPKNDLQRYLVIAYWYKHHRGTEEVNQDHFFTAFRHLQLTVPRDPRMPIRDLRHPKRTQFSAGKTRGSSVINHVGENIVLEMGKAE